MGSLSIRSSVGEVDQNGIMDSRDVMCRSPLEAERRAGMSPHSVGLTAAVAR